MIYFMEPLPESGADTAGWQPFIRNPSNALVKAGLFAGVYFVHELLHMAVIYRAGDVSITHSFMFLWITSGAILGKCRFFVFMSLPFIILTAVPAIVCPFLSGEWRSMTVYIAWINSVIAGSDLINAVLIAIKPSRTMFYRGYYRTEDQ